MATDHAGYDYNLRGDQRMLPEVKLSDLEIDPEMEHLRYATLSARIQLSVTDMRKATRMLLDEAPTEARLLFYVLLSDVIFFLNFGLKYVVSPNGDRLRDQLPEELAGTVGGFLVLCFLLRTMTLYGFSAVVTVVCKVFGGGGSFRDTRAGIFWASLVAAPIGVLGAVLISFLGYLEPSFPFLANPNVQMPGQLMGVVAFVFFVSAAVAEAHRFRATSLVFVVFSLLTVAILVGGLYAGALVMSAL